MINWPEFLSADARLDLWTILVAIVTNTSCAIVGCYLVLRRMSLLGDAISHSVLAGIAFAFLATGSLSYGPMLIGAVLVGLLTAFLTQSLQWLGNVPEDSSMGVVFTSLFALGVVVIAQFDDLHIDVRCVLEGDLDLVTLDVLSIRGYELPRVLLSLFPIMLLTTGFVALLWKELKIAAFDPMLATAMGLSAAVIHYLLMGMVAAVTVTSLEAVGAIIAVAMLIVPGATAHLLTDRLGWMIAWAVLIGIVAAVAGWYAARWLDTTASGVIAAVAGLQFLAAVLFAPRHGLLARALSRARLSLRIAAEDLLALLYRSEEKSGSAANAALPVDRCLSLIGGGWRARLAASLLRRRGQIEFADEVLRLTDQGRQAGRSLVRSHRLWEAYLQEHFELPHDHLHEPAERIEHYIGPELQEKLARELAQPDRDPHGAAIPPQR